MADNFIERKRDDYEARKQAWLRKKKHQKQIRRRDIQKFDNEFL